jgi:tetratricopeptide (TPR) repeat protein
MFKPDSGRWLLAWVLFAVLAPAQRISIAQIPSQTQPAQPLQSPARPQAAIRVIPSRPPTAEDRGDAHFLRRQYQAAIAAYAKDPSPSAIVWNKMGISYQMLYDLKDAAHCFRAALKLDPHSAKNLNNLGVIYQLQRDYKQAERMYRRALQFHPPLPHSRTSALILKNLGTAFLAEGKYDQGWEAYRKAVALDPGVFADTRAPRVDDPSPIRQNGAVNYFMAKGCAHAGRIKCAVKYLRLSLDERFTTVKKVVRSSDFDGIRKNVAFQRLLAEETQDP